MRDFLVEEQNAMEIAKMILLLDRLRDELYEQLLNTNGNQGHLILRALQNAQN
jgi:hypothetical protein